MCWTLVAGLAVVLSAPGHAQQRTGLAAAADAMGAASLNSIEFTGSGNVFSFGQAYEPGERWPRFIQRTYSAAINYQTPAANSPGRKQAARRRLTTALPKTACAKPGPRLTALSKLPWPTPAKSTAIP
jgi:hypothetical protein